MSDTVDIKQMYEKVNGVNTKVAPLTPSAAIYHGRERLSEIYDKLLTEDDIVNSLGDGTRYVPSQKLVSDRIIGIENDIWPLKSNLVIDPPASEYTGEEQNVTISWDLTRKGVTISDDYLNSLIITVNEDEFEKSEASGSMVVPINNLGSSLIEISATTADHLSAAEGKSYVQYAPIYCGFSYRAFDSTKYIRYSKQSVEGEYTITNDTVGKFLWFCVPSDLLVNKVFLSGIEVPMDPYQEETFLGVSYKCYRSSNAFQADTYEFKVE